jgi:hypothetical protein
MAEIISGTTMVLTWVTSAGTVALAGDFRSCTWAPSIDYVDASAGADTQHGRLTALKDARADVVLVAQAGGTQISTYTQAGQAGTLTIQPEGTATNKRKITFPSYCDGAQVEMPYAEVVVYSIGFTAAGAVLTAWTDAVN